ncbi:MAG: EAL domain-containing protein [Pseudomonadota bacterium]
MLAESLGADSNETDGPTSDGFTDAGRILVIDDRATTRAMVVGALSVLGYEVTEASTAQQGMALALREPFDLIIVDRQMPELSGLELTRAVRRRFADHERPIIILSHDDAGSTIGEVLRAGANDVVRKPVDFSQLVARVRTQLRRKHAEERWLSATRDLDRHVASRTSELIRTNTALRNELIKHQRVEQRLRERERTYRAFYEQNPSMFYTLDRRGIITSTNLYGAEQLGYTRDELVGSPLELLYPDAERRNVAHYVDACWEAPTSVRRWETRKVCKDGSTMWVRTTARVVDHDADPRLLMVCEDVTEAHNLSELLTYQASHDPLTGLVNRREFEKRLQRVLDTAKGSDDMHALCYMDLDQFKIVNDTCGHLAGDELLRQLSGVLQETVRRRDTLSRLGGDEFAVLMEYCGLEQAQRVANSIRDAVAEFRFAWLDKSFTLGVSIGLVPITGATQAVADVMRAADTACYVAKDAGRSRIHVYQEDDEESARRQGENQWLIQVQRALRDDRFFLEFQPIISLHSSPGSEFQDVEVLLRMHDDAGDIVHPGAFLPTSQRYNLCGDIDRWVVEHTFRWLQTTEYRTFINLNAESLADEGFVRFLEDRFREYRLAPERICFEFTESTAISNLANATRFTKVLKDWGCRVALDGFGGGMSSYAYLKTLPVDILKVDGTFVKDIIEDPLDLAMVQSFHQIGRVTGKETLALFVESPDILARVRSIGFDYAQGFSLGRPRSIAN